MKKKLSELSSHQNSSAQLPAEVANKMPVGHDAYPSYLSGTYILENFLDNYTLSKFKSLMYM